MQTLEELIDDLERRVSSLRRNDKLKANVEVKAALDRAADVLPHGRAVLAALRESLTSLDKTLTQFELKN